MGDRGTRASPSDPSALICCSVGSALGTSSSCQVLSSAQAAPACSRVMVRFTVSSGTLLTHGPLFVGLLIGTVLLVGLLNYVPSLALGPIVEHLLLWKL